MSELVLRDIDKDNFIECIDLRVSEEQKTLVASNLFSLAQSKVYKTCVPLAIYSDDTMVGFVMYRFQEEDGEYWIYRLMIDQRFQGNGYGRKAMNEILSILRSIDGCERVYISYEPTNTGAERLYESLGFQSTGRVLNGEIVRVLNFKKE